MPRSTDTEIVPTAAAGELSTELVDTMSRARTYARNSRSKRTLDAYASDWKMFTKWCRRHQLSPLPAEPVTVVLYFTQLAEGTAFPDEKEPFARRPSTIRRHAATIAVAHRLAKTVSPIDEEEVQAVLLGITKTLGGAPKKKTAAVREIVTDMVHSIDEEVSAPGIAIRNRAIVLVGFGGALRRSEIVGLDVEHVEFRPRGMILTIVESKTDKERKGQTVLINKSEHADLCPMRSLQAWLRELPVSSGAIFRSLSRRNKMQRLSGETVANVIKDAASNLKLNPDAFGGHSLRSGHVTTAVRDGTRIDVVQKQTRHKVLQTLLEYLEREGSWDDNSSKGII